MGERRSLTNTIVASALLLAVSLPTAAKSRTTVGLQSGETVPGKDLDNEGFIIWNRGWFVSAGIDIAFGG